MYASIETILGPQATTAVCLGHFTTPHTVSLVSIKSDWIELYDVVSLDAAATRLVLRHRHQLAAPCLSAVRVAGLSVSPPVDGLLLSFEGSRYSTVVFDGATGAFLTVSLHQYDEERFGGDGAEMLSVSPEAPIRTAAAVERGGRCAVLRVFREHFAVVPFERLASDDADMVMSGGEGRGGLDDERLPGWVIRFSQVDQRLGGVVDWCFLEGYSEPTLGLLFNQGGRPAWAGRSVTNKRDNLCYAVITLDLRNQTQSLIHYQEGLPNDLDALFPCDKPVGGCFAVGTSAFIHLEQGSQGCGFAVNAFASRLSDYRFLPILDPLEVTIENAVMVHVEKEVFWLCLVDGRRLTVKVTKGSRFVNNIVVHKGDNHNEHQPVNCFSTLDGYLVVGSDCGDTILYGRPDASLPQQQHHHHQTTNPITVSGHFDENDLYLAEMELEERQRVAPDQQHQLTIVDRLPSVGSFNDITVAFGANHVNVERPVTARSPRHFVAVCGRGCGWNGIAVLSPHLPVREVARFPVPGATALFVLSNHRDTSKYLLVSTPHSTLALQMTSATGGALEEVEESDFYLEGATMAAATTASGFYMQVHATGVRLLDGTRMLHEESFGGTRCLRAVCHGNLIAVIDNKLADRVFTVDANHGLTCVYTGSDAVTASGFFDRDGVTFYYRLTRQGVFTVNDNDGVVFFCSTIGLLPYILSESSSSSDATTTATTIVTPEHLMVIGKDRLVHIIVAVKGQLAVYTNHHDSRWTFVKKECRMMRVLSMSAPFQLGHQDITAVSVNSGTKMWTILIGPRGYPRIQPIWGNIQHVSSLGDGQLLFVDKSSRVRLVQIDDRFDLDRPDCSVMMKRIDGGDDDNGQLHRIVYLPSVNAFVVTRRSSVPFTLPSDDFSADADHPEFEYPRGAPTPRRFRYSVCILSPISWTITDSMLVEEQPNCTAYDSVVDMRVCTLTTKSHQSGRKALVVLGLASQKAEDRPIRGRCLVVDVTEVVPEPGRPETNRRLRLLCSADMKTTVGAVCELKGAVLVSQGARIIVYELENDDALQGCAFVDSAIFSARAASLDGLFALGDVQRGVSLYAYQEEPPKIVQVARALDAVTARQSVTAVEFLVGKASMVVAAGPTAASQPEDTVMIVSADQLGNVLLHTFSPKHPKSMGGAKLVLRGSTRLPSTVHRMQRLVDKVFLYLTDGSVMIMSGLSQADYKRQSALQSQLFKVVPSVGGPGWRHARQPRLPCCPVDGMPAMPRAVIDKTVLAHQVGVMMSGVQARLCAMRAMVDFEAVKTDLEPFTI